MWIMYDRICGNIMLISFVCMYNDINCNLQFHYQPDCKHINNACLCYGPGQPLAFAHISNSIRMYLCMRMSVMQLAT